MINAVELILTKLPMSTQGSENLNLIRGNKIFEISEAVPCLKPLPSGSNFLFLLSLLYL